MSGTDREIARPGRGMARALGGPFGEKIRKPSTSVHFRHFGDPSERHNSLEPCGERSLNPCFSPMPLKGRFWAKKPVKWRGIAQFVQVFDRSLTIDGRA